ncbi:hypothetical protein [Pontibacillus salipaludis]|uniref:Uncharacterized protein n=1 Tax=Pontibacillus salipaludis TaxID=1697394 RepID=A0ABQ1Q7H0_9BACI|nr:hypothetical protein [Pontibacillus salipaludis]GGD15432.1 hypothetical protein GCM10011389_23910 [Pontibacillus salipaludis]
MKKCLIWLMAMIISMLLLIWVGFNEKEGMMQILLSLNLIVYFGLKRAERNESC